MKRAKGEIIPDIISMKRGDSTNVHQCPNTLPLEQPWPQNVAEIKTFVWCRSLRGFILFSFIFHIEIFSSAGKLIMCTLKIHNSIVYL